MTRIGSGGFPVVEDKFAGVLYENDVFGAGKRLACAKVAMKLARPVPPAQVTSAFQPTLRPPSFATPAFTAWTRRPPRKRPIKGSTS